jgi:ubiquinone/menaquinone biosynthesis C-methylase UbiE
MTTVRRREPSYGTRSRYVGRVASSYEEKRRNEAIWRWEDEQVRRFFSTLEPSLILDVPCGTSRFTAVLAGLGHRIVGVDVSVDMLREGISRSDGHRAFVLCGDALHLPLRSMSVDHTLSNRFIQWLPGRRHVAFVMEEFFRVSRRSVMVQLRTPPPLFDVAGQWRRIRGGLLRAIIPGRRRRAHIRTYRPALLRRIARPHGFSLTGTSGFGPGRQNHRYLVFTRLTPTEDGPGGSARR